MVPNRFFEHSCAYQGLQRIPEEPVAAAAECIPPELLQPGRSVYDDDDFDINTRDAVDLSRMISETWVRTGFKCSMISETWVRTGFKCSMISDTWVRTGLKCSMISKTWVRTGLKCSMISETWLRLGFVLLDCYSGSG
jgi:hypothetical protein